MSTHAGSHAWLTVRAATERARAPTGQSNARNDQTTKQPNNQTIAISTMEASPFRGGLHRLALATLDRPSGLDRPSDDRRPAGHPRRMTGRQDPVVSLHRGLTSPWRHSSATTPSMWTPDSGSSGMELSSRCSPPVWSTSTVSPSCTVPASSIRASWSPTSVWTRRRSGLAP